MMNAARDTSPEEIARALARPALELVRGPVERRAAVAMVLSEGSVLLIERASHPADPWSGHLAFPGGRVESEDADPQSAAERETAEEVGLDLRGARYLGLLGQFPARPLSLAISVFCYATDERPVLTLDTGEVRHAFWVSLGDLVDPSRQVRHRPPAYGGDRPGICVLGPGRPVLWGLTYHFLEVLLHRLGQPLPPTGYQDLDRLHGEMD